MFTRILIAGRSAAAQRVSRTCHRLGITTVGVFESESENVHLAACDERLEVSVVNGRPSPEALTSLAKEHTIDAIHPGFVDDTDDPTLARVLEAEGLSYVGLDPDAMDTVRSRSAFRECVERCGARCVPAVEGIKSAPDAVQAARELEFPVRLRGGGVHEILHDDEDLYAAWERLSTQEDIAVEKWFHRARSIDVIVGADSEGAVEPLVERETSLRHEGHVVLEESPAPALTFRIDGEAIRELMFDVALRVAKELGSVGLIRVEMLLTAEGAVYATGARLGLPSLHAVVERVTNLDLLQLQLQLAAGEPLPEAVCVLQPSGCALGARVIAADPEQLNDSLSDQHFPSAPQRSVVVESSTTVGGTLPPDDRPVIARVTSFSPIRHQAALTLARILSGARVEPLKTNGPLLRLILNDEGFRAGSYDNQTIARLLTPADAD